MKSYISVTLIFLLAVSGLTACGQGGEDNPATSSPGASSSSSTSDSTGSVENEAVRKVVEDGRGGEADCRTGPGGEPADFGDILGVAVDYDGQSTVMLDITFAGDAQAKIAEKGGTKYNGYVQAEIGTTYPFAASTSTGEFEASPNSLAESFKIDWLSGSEARITIGGFEAGGGPIVKAELNTLAPTQGQEIWCDRVTVDF